MATRVRNVGKANAATKAVAAGVAPPTSAVVSEGEMSRFYDIVENKTVVEAKSAVAHRQDLREKSDARVSHWPNTIEAQRLKKERTRRERFDVEEERRKVIDEQETALKAAKQEHAIRKANLLLYEQNDRIKTFSSKLFLASVLDERQKQLSVKHEKKALAQQVDAHWGMVQAAELRKAEQAETSKAKASDDRAYALKEAQLSQLADIRVTKIARRDGLYSEGQAIKKLAEVAVAEEIENEEKRKENQRGLSKELVAANTESRRIRDAQKAADVKEEEKILAFAAQKEQQMLERKRRVDEKFVAKQARRQDLIDVQGELLQEIKNATEEREMKAMRDFDRERREREERENAVRTQRQREIDVSRSSQLARRENKKQHEHAQKSKMQAQWRHHAERLIDEELDELRDRRSDAERNQHMLLLQVQEKKQQGAHERRQDYLEGIQMQQAMAEEQASYESYVNSIMHGQVAQGAASEIVKSAARRNKTMAE
jgi:hypothetical protein